MPTAPDIHIPNTIATNEDTFSPTFIRRLLTKLSGIIAIDQEQDPATWAEEWQMLQIFFWGLKPTNPVEAVLAARVVNSHYRSMELVIRAVQPGQSDEKALRLHTSANAVTRAFFAALSRLEKRQQRGAPVGPEPIVLPLFNALPATTTTPPLNGFANRAARRAAAALARKPARLSHNGA